MNFRYPLHLLLVFIVLYSCKSQTADNLEEIARRSSNPEAVLVETSELEPSTFYKKEVFHV